MFSVSMHNFWQNSFAWPKHGNLNFCHAFLFTATPMEKFGNINGNNIGRVLFAFLNVLRTYKSRFQKEQKKVDISTPFPVANQRAGKVFKVF